MKKIIILSIIVLSSLCVNAQTKVIDLLDASDSVRIAYTTNDHTWDTLKLSTANIAALRQVFITKGDTTDASSVRHSRFNFHIAIFKGKYPKLIFLDLMNSVYYLPRSQAIIVPAFDWQQMRLFFNSAKKK